MSLICRYVESKKDEFGARADPCHVDERRCQDPARRPSTRPGPARPAAERLMRSMGLKGHPQGQDAPHDALRTA